MAVAVAILAAGRGSRLSRRTPKPLARVGGRPLVAWALDAALASGCEPVLVVVGRGARRVARVALSEGSGSGEVGAATRQAGSVRVVRARRWRRGIAHSLSAALAALEPDAEVDAVCIGLADQPLVGAGSYRRLAAAHADGALLAVATYRGQRGNPVLLARSLWPAASALRGDSGARQLMDTQPVTEVDCTDTGAPTDVDTLDDLRRIERAMEWEKDRDADH